MRHPADQLKTKSSTLLRAALSRKLYVILLWKSKSSPYVSLVEYNGRISPDIKSATISQQLYKLICFQLIQLEHYYLLTAPPPLLLLQYQHPKIQCCRKIQNLSSSTLHCSSIRDTTRCICSREQCSQCCCCCRLLCYRCCGI